MGLLGFGKKAETYLVVVISEGKDRLRLNGNLIRGDKKAKKGAASHSRTVCWAEFATDGTRRDDGLGPMASSLGEGGADRLLRELPQTAACRQLLEALGEGKPIAGKWLVWGDSSLPTGR
jgi:hypothetical protein